MATAQNNRVNFTTLEKYLPKVVDTVNKSNWVINRTMTAPQPWNGRAIYQAITTSTSSLGTSFKGVESFPTTIDFAPIQMVWYPTGYAQPVTISTVERSINQTPLGEINLYKSSFEWAQNSMSQALGTIMYGFGTGNDFDGLGLIVDDGTSTSSYAGLSRSTYGNFINCGGSTGIIAASGGVLDLATMDSADDASRASGLASETTNVVITTVAAQSLYASLLEPTKVATYNVMGGGINTGDGGVGSPVSVTNGVKLNGGSVGVTYRNKDVVADNKCTSGVMFFMNESYLEFNSLSLTGLTTVKVANSVTEGVYDKVPPTAFQWRDLMSPVNQLAEVGIFVVYGNLIHRNPIRNEKITGITGV